MFDQITHPQQRAFLAAYSQCGVIKDAAELTGISREAHYDWMRTESYRRAFEEARRQAADTLEDIAFQRATRHGSDKMLMFLLRGLKAEYSTKTVEHKGEVRHQHEVDLSVYTDEELKLLHELACKAESRSNDASARELEEGNGHPGPADARSGDGEAPGPEAGPDVPGGGTAEA